MPTYLYPDTSYRPTDITAFQKTNWSAYKRSNPAASIVPDEYSYWSANEYAKSTAYHTANFTTF
jgi:hypothetical protein